ncbi:MAG: flippase-like domain-containing protein [Bacteroidetes bacterium]|nr:flippase-like domain-containing protein [Bacteroidota bacterium]
MKKKILIGVFSIISIGFFLSANTFADILPRLSKIKPGYIYAFFILVIIEHIFRALRWQILLKRSHSEVKLFPTLLALLMSFFSNIFIPHSGIITRLTYLKKYYKFPPSINIGTFIAEKTSDSIIIILLLSYTALHSGFSFFKIIDFSPFKDKLLMFSAMGLLIIPLVIFLIARIFRSQLLKIRIIIYAHLKLVLSGFHSLHDLKSLLLFSIYSAIIWIIYIFSFNLMFLSVGIDASPVCLINTATIGNLSWIFPSQAGIGPFHLAVSTALRFHGYTAEDSTFLSILTHSGILITDFVFGLSAIIFTILGSAKKSNYVSSDPIMAIAD